MSTKTVAQYLIDALLTRGVRHVFGIPGDYSLAFYQCLEESELQVINMCDEQGAGFAADGYARATGLGVACVTYGVGGLKLANTTAQAYAERSPVIVISGAPGLQERCGDPLLHHKIRDFDTQLSIFRELTAAAQVLTSPAAAGSVIERALDAAASEQRPVYLELPRDLVAVHVETPRARLQSKPSQASAAALNGNESSACRAAVDAICAMLSHATQPVLLVGVEAARFGVRRQIVQLAEEHNIPLVATALGKSVIDEAHPLYLGIYEGAMGRASVRDYVEGSDCVIALGALFTDVNLGIFTAHLDPKRLARVCCGETFIGGRVYAPVDLAALTAALAKNAEGRYARPPAGQRVMPLERAPTQEPVTAAWLFAEMNRQIDETMAIVADTGDALFGSLDLLAPHAHSFFAPAYYTSVGFAIPAAIGVQLAMPQMRPLVIVGDGAFQMTGMELSTAARYGLNPIVVVLNNRGYGTERPMLDGPFNDLREWRYHALPQLLQSGWSAEITSEQAFVDAFCAAKAHPQEYCLLNVHLDPWDASPALQRLTSALRAQVVTG